MNREKKSFIWKIAAAFLFVFLLFFLYKKMTNKKMPQSQYAEVKNDGYYHLVMQDWSGEGEHNLKLQEGDVLQIGWKIEEGDISISILLDAERSIYKADHVSTGDTPMASFEVTVPEDGAYVLYASGQSAVGEITVKKK